MAESGRLRVMDVTELTRALVRIPSVSGGESECVAFLAGELRAFDPVVSGRNLFAVRGDGPRTLLLNSHTDTVPASADWTLDPHAAELRDGKVHGLGANDAKGPLAALACAFATAAVPAGARLVLAATCEEETGGPGLGTLLPELPRPDAAVVGEPTGLAVCSGQRGLLRLRLTARGRSAHASRPWQGENAIAKAALDILALERLDLGEPHPQLGAATLQVTMIEGGVRTNVVPSACTLEIDARTLPGLDNSTLHDRVVACVESDVELVSDRFAPVETSPGEAIVRAALAAAGCDAPSSFGGVSDLHHVRHVPGIVLGPGRSEQSHAADEWIETNQLERAVDVYSETIRRYFES
jgi:acetylornithine deacetylase